MAKKSFGREKLLAPTQSPLFGAREAKPATPAECPGISAQTAQ